MSTNLKHRQHHVCQTYLRGWATDGKVWVLQAGVIRRAPTRDVAVKRHFYKLQALTEADLLFLRAWISKSPKRLQRSHENFITMFGFPPTMRQQLPEAVVAANPELVARLDEQIVNAEEDFHSSLEGNVAPQIEAMRQGDVSFFADKYRGAKFAHFLALQHFRTNAMKTRVITRLRVRMGLDVSRAWNVLAHIIASNVGFTFYLERKSNPLALLTNNTALPFITSDQPTINLLGASDTDVVPEHLALYYPVSPTRAVVLDAIEQPCGLVGKVLTDNDVKSLNAQVLRASVLQVFASSRDALEGISAQQLHSA